MCAAVDQPVLKPSLTQMLMSHATGDLCWIQSIISPLSVIHEVFLLVELQNQISERPEPN